MSTGSRIKTVCASTSWSRRNSRGRPCPPSPIRRANISGGAIVAHGNLFGQGKRGVIGGRISNVDSGALAAYEDRRCGARGFFSLSRGSTNCRSFPNTATSTATCQACRCRRCATPSCAPTAATSTWVWPGFARCAPRSGGFLTRTTSSGQPAILTTVLPRFSTCRQARPADGGAPPRPM